MKAYTQEELAQAVTAAVNQKYETLGKKWDSASNRKALALVDKTPEGVYETGLQCAAKIGLSDAQAVGFAEVYVNEYSRGVAFGTEEERLKERWRAKSILKSPEAKGRFEFARYLACETDLSADEAIGLLGKMPLDSQSSGFCGFNRRQINGGQNDGS